MTFKELTEESEKYANESCEGMSRVQESAMSYRDGFRNALGKVNELLGPLLKLAAKQDAAEKPRVAVSTNDGDGDNDRLGLWAHLVSMHAGIYSLDLTLKQLMVIHDHEHDGPGTIRNHPRHARHADLTKIGKVLDDGEPHCGEVLVDSQSIFRVCTLEPGHAGKHHG